MVAYHWSQSASYNYRLTFKVSKFCLVMGKLLVAKKQIQQIGVA